MQSTLRQSQAAVMLRSTALAVALVTSLASTAFANKITINGHSDYRQGLGGEFNVTAADAGGAALLAQALSGGYTTVNGTDLGTADGTRMGVGFGGLIGFESFCIEYNETVSLGGTYDVAISNGSIYGGVGGGIDHDGNPATPTTDFISVGTAFLYSRFATGVLNGYQYQSDVIGSDTRAASAEQLQNAIWWLEDELSFNPLLNPFLQLAFAAHGTPGAGVGADAGGAKANNTQYNVRALNLGGPSPHQQQDQLIMTVPDGGVSAILLSLGLSGLALIRRKS